MFGNLVKNHEAYVNIEVHKGKKNLLLYIGKTFPLGIKPHVALNDTGKVRKCKEARVDLNLCGYLVLFKHQKEDSSNKQTTVVGTEVSSSSSSSPSSQ